ncbi:MAG: hypothetical protein MI810_02360 [Flavobacteriales bacterium]|nr:hypothetical protein [Flavobacteriales bacterium]
MAIESRDVLKTYFQAGDVPTESQFGDLIDSFISRLDDGVYVFDVPGTDEKRFGVGIQEPLYPLGVQGAGTFDALISFHEPTGIPSWLLNMQPDGAAESGLNFEQQTPAGGQSRLFLNGTTGNVGIGTFEPQQKLQIETSTPAGLAGLKVLNTASLGNQGWAIGHQQDNLADRDGGLSILENEPNQERLFIRPGGNVGINEPIPDTKLHVSRPVADAQSIISLAEGTGIAVVGPITNNIVMDFQGIQAREGETIGDVVSLEVSDLHLQNLGGDIVIHGDGEIDEGLKAIVTNEAAMGLGTLTPEEKLEVNGAIKLGNTTNDNLGTIRWNGTDFQGRTATEWVSLTGGNGSAPFWVQGPENAIFYSAAKDPRVGIGTDNPQETLAVNDTETSAAGNTAVGVVNQSTTTSTSEDSNRIAMDLSCVGDWGGSDNTKNIGLYVSEVVGQSAPECNLAGVLNGNVVVGELSSGLAVVGRGGSRVLALQNGTVPTGTAAVASTQLYSQDLGDVPTLHVMRGNGEVIKIYQETPLTAANNEDLPRRYNESMDIIENMRERINELEQRLQAIGFLG